MIASSKKKIRVKYAPLKVNCGIEVIGGVNTRQTVKNGEYSPDYSLTPLVLDVRCTASKEGTSGSSINASLTNMAWYKTENGSESLIVSGVGGFTIVQEGTNKGRLTMSRNGTAAAPITLRFHAEYVNVKSGEVYNFDDSILLQCVNESLANPLLKIDAPASVLWNPLKDTRSQKRLTITASLQQGENDITNDAKTAYFWYRAIISGSTQNIVAITGENDGDGDIVSVSGKTLVIDLECLGSIEDGKKVDRVTYICMAGYDGKSKPSSPSGNIAPKYCTVKRYLGELECDYGNVADVPEETPTISPKALVWDNDGMLTDAQINAELICRWNTHGVSSTAFSEVAKGISPSITLAADTILKLELEDRGSYEYLADADGYVITDADGAVIIDRTNNF